MWSNDDEKQLCALLKKKQTHMAEFKVLDSVIDTLINARNNNYNPRITWEYSRVDPLALGTANISIRLGQEATYHFMECFNSDNS